MWSPPLLLLLISTIVLIDFTVPHASKDGPTTGNTQHAGIEDQYQASSLPHKRVKRVKIKEVSELAPEEYESTKKVVEDCLSELRTNKTRVEAELADARAQLTTANADYEKAEQKWKEKKEESEKAEEGEEVDELQESVHKQLLQAAADSAREDLKIAEREVEQLLAGEADKFAGAQRLRADYAVYQRELPDKIKTMKSELVPLQRKFKEALLPKTELAQVQKLQKVYASQRIELPVTIDALKKNISEVLMPQVEQAKRPKMEAEKNLTGIRNQLKKLKCSIRSQNDPPDCGIWKDEERAAKAAAAAAAAAYNAATRELNEAKLSVSDLTTKLSIAGTYPPLDNFVEAWLRNVEAEKAYEDARKKGGKQRRVKTDKVDTSMVKAVYEKKRDAAQTIVTSLEKKLADLDGEITKGEQQAKNIQQKIELSKETPEPFNEFTNPYAIILYVLIAITVVFVTVCMVRSCRKQRREKKNNKAVMNLPKPFRYEIPPNSNKDEGSGLDSSSNAAQPSNRDSNKDSGSDSSNVAQPSNRDSNKGSGSDSSSKAPQSSKRDRKRGSGSDSSSKAPQSSKRDRKRGSGSDSSSKAKSSKRDSKKGSGSDSSSKAKSSKRDSKKEKPSTPSSHSDETKRPSQRSSSEKKNNKSDP